MACITTHPGGGYAQRSPMPAVGLMSTTSAAVATPGPPVNSCVSLLSGVPSSQATLSTAAAALAVGRAPGAARACECCRCDHDGGYGSGRFCSVHCARRVAASRKWAKRRLSAATPSAGADVPQTTTSASVNPHKRQRPRPPSPGPACSSLTLPRSPTRSAVDDPPSPTLSASPSPASPPLLPSPAARARRVVHRREAVAKARHAPLPRVARAAAGTDVPSTVGSAAPRGAAPPPSTAMTPPLDGRLGAGAATAAGGTRLPAADPVEVRLPPLLHSHWRPVAWATACSPVTPPLPPPRAADAAPSTTPRPRLSATTTTLPPLSGAPSSRPPSDPTGGGSYVRGHPPSPTHAQTPPHGAHGAYGVPPPPPAGMAYAPLPPPYSLWMPSVQMMPAIRTVAGVAAGGASCRRPSCGPCRQRP